MKVAESVDTVGMQIASYEIDVAQAGLVVTPVILLAAAGIWLLLASGVIGRIALFFEEMPHRRAALESQVSSPRSQRTAHVSRFTLSAPNPVEESPAPSGTGPWRSARRL